MRILLVAVAALAASAAPAPRPPSLPPWGRVDYSGLVDTRQLTHSGDPVGVLLQRLGGRTLPKPGDRPEDALAYRLLDPILEPYAFVLPDALDTLAPAPDPPMVEVGSLWSPGEEQPAWVELARARNLLLESDGEGHLRAFVPAASDVTESDDPAVAAEQAWHRAWPVLRHALAGERRRLQDKKGGPAPPLDVEVHAYRHRLASSTFDLGVTAWRTTVTETGPSGNHPSLDLGALRSILDRRQTIEGGRLESGGRVRWFTSESEIQPTILGRPPTLADLAVAYRAVAAGGYGEPYMSLDRSESPHVANVNYGGRLRDTALGEVSLLSDVRFKTFSVGVDLLGEGDVRDTIRRTLPGFLTHLERFAANPSAGAVLNQQTRFWFYPDEVDLTLSEQGDVLAFRKVRMSAASERVKEAGAAAAEPVWTKDTVADLNAHYAVLASLFPELRDLDESVRLLAMFTWLTMARDRGLEVPDLDVLMAVDLPAISTPRRFPELLSHDVLPPPGKAGVVDVLDRTDVGIALDRLEPDPPGAWSATRRFARALSQLNPAIPDQAALGNEMSQLPADASDVQRDLLSYRAARLQMHARVLATIPEERRRTIDDRRGKDAATRVFSVGIGGIDLGMNAVLARAAHRSAGLGAHAEPGAERAPAATANAVAGDDAPPSATQDPVARPWPDHGLGSSSDRQATPLPQATGTIESRARPGSLVRRGAYQPADGASTTWTEVVLDAEGPEVRARRVIVDPAASGPLFQRVEGGRFLSYRFTRMGGELKAVAAPGALPAVALNGPSPAAPVSPEPLALTLLDLPNAPAETDASSVTVRVRSPDGRARSASFPRALLQRLVRGRALDTTPDRPLAGFTPASQILGDGDTLMIVEPDTQHAAPWSGPRVAQPGEETASHLAAALTAWWSAGDGARARAVVGVDEAASAARWAHAPRLDGTVTVLLDDGGMTSTNEAMHAAIGAWPSAPGGRVVVVVGLEPPGLLGQRLRALAKSDDMKGKILVVVPLSGPLRRDLPASLLAEGRIGAFASFEPGPTGLRKSIASVAAWIGAAAGEPGKGKRAEELPGPFTWFY